MPGIPARGFCTCTMPLARAPVEELDGKALSFAHARCGDWRAFPSVNPDRRAGLVGQIVLRICTGRYQSRVVESPPVFSGFYKCPASFFSCWQYLVGSLLFPRTYKRGRSQIQCRFLPIRSPDATYLYLKRCQIEAMFDLSVADIQKGYH